MVSLLSDCSIKRTNKFGNSASLAQSATDESFDAFDAQLEDVAHTIRTAEQAICRLRSYRNRVCRMHRLPVETLRAIFEFASLCGACESVNKVITHVCSYWRTIALNNPQLWTCFDTNKMTKVYTEEAAIRSHNLPLHILTLVPPKPPSRRAQRAGTPEWIIDFVVDNLYRIRVLHIKPPTSGLRLLMVAAPVLEELCLHPESARHSLVWNSELFGGQAPVLRTLGLKYFRLPLEAGVYKNLTKLDVEAMSTHPSATETIRFICRESPDLEILRLRLGVGEGHDFHMPTPPPEDHHTRVTMHNLRCLDLYMRVELVAQLLSTIRFIEQPEEVKITACVTRGDQFEALFTSRYMPALFFENLHEIAVENDPGCELRLRGLTSYANVGDRTWSMEQRTIQGMVPTSGSDFEVLATTIGNSRPMPMLQSFQIMDYVEDPEFTLPAHVTNFLRGAIALLMCCARTVTTFAVESGRCPGDWTYESHPISTTFESIHSHLRAVDNPSGPPLLPLLEKCTFAVWGPGNDPGQHPCEDFMHVDHIVRLLNPDIQRLEITGWGHLAISSSETARECVRRLRELAVPQTYWDKLRFWPKSPIDTTRFETVKGGFYPRDIWPEGESYTWKCAEEEEKGSHTKEPYFPCCGLESLEE